MLGKLKSWHWIWIVPLILGFYLSLRFVNIYFNWSKKQDTILSKLVSYKKQLDFLRNPVNIDVDDDQRSNEVNIGAVALPSRIYDRNNNVIGEFYSERRSLIPIEKLPKYLMGALIASEDRKFYQHKGINYFGIIRAFVKNLLSFRIAQGGSTITQQLAKVLFTRREKTLERKIFEFFCAKEIEKNYTKKEILEMYLNLIYLGHGTYGIESATQYYFGKSASKLSKSEVATIIGLIPNPRRYSPIKNLRRSLIKQRLVLKALLDTGQLSEKQAKREKRKFILRWKVKKEGEKYVSNIGNFPDRSYKINRAPFFLDNIRHKLLAQFNSEQLNKGGLKIYTTLDIKRQIAARTQLKSAILAQQKHYDKLIAKTKNKKKLKELIKSKKTTNGAFITIEPKTGYILTMVGGREFSKTNQFNRALKAKRQIGSLMKPFVYYLNFEQKTLTPASIIADKKLVIGKKNFRNYDYRYKGDMTVYEALAKSRNTPAIRALQLVGVNDLRHLFSDVLDIPYDKITKRIPKEIVVALGTPSFTPYEVAKAFSVMLNEGKRVVTRDLLRVENNQGKILWEAEEPPTEIELLNPSATLVTLKTMKGVVGPLGTSGWVGRKFPFEVAGKTGTTSSFNDAWFVGITGDEVSAIWIGNDINKTLGRGRSGGGLCAPVWVNYMKRVGGNYKPPNLMENFESDNITTESFCADKGCIPRDKDSCKFIVKDMPFLSGTEPKKYCVSDKKNSDNDIDLDIP